MFCPSCGTRLTDGSRFCGQCGSPVEGTPPASTPLPAKTPAPSSETPMPVDPDNLDGARTLIEREAPPVQAELAPGQVFHDRYRIEKPLGQGGMGAVYLAQDTVTGDAVCLKVILPGLVRSESLAKRFLREGKVARGLRHPNIVAVYDVNVWGSSHYLSMEYLPGIPLRKWIFDNLREKRDVPLHAACGIVREILKGLGAAHEASVVHRDVKPENIMLIGDPGKGEFHLKIMDFGIARALRSSEVLTGSGAALGTPVYMAPEQETAAEAAGPESDLYSLAVIFYEILFNLPPRGRWELPSALRPDLPKGLDPFFQQALHPLPAHRWPSAAQFEAGLFKALSTSGHGGSPRTAAPPRAPAPPQPPPPLQPPPRAPEVSRVAAPPAPSGPGAPATGRQCRVPPTRIASDPVVQFMIWPKSMAQWIICNIIPGLAPIAWFNLWLRTHWWRHLIFSGIYALPLLCLIPLIEDFDSVDEEMVIVIITICVVFWIAAVFHSLVNIGLVEDLIRRSKGR
jgi:serine/threonine protein kinase